MGADPAPTLPQCSAVAAAVKAVVRQQNRKSRLPWRKLCLDILSVLCGLRPAAMLDYAVVPRRVLLQLAAAVRVAAGPAGQVLVTAEHEGVMYFLNAEWLLGRLDAEHTSGASAASSAGGKAGRPDPDIAATAPYVSALDAGLCSRSPQQVQHEPRFIVFDEAAAGCQDTVVRWAYTSEQQEVLASLRLLQEFLQQALGASVELAACKATRTCAAGMSAAPAAEVAGTHLLLDHIPGLPLLPTLNGWLLGYPAVYLTRTAYEVAVAARHLSTVPLLHCAAHSECCIDGLQSQVGDKDQWLYAFTVPAGLITVEELLSMGWTAPASNMSAPEIISKGQDLRGPGHSGCSAAVWSAVRQVAGVRAPGAIVL